MATREDSTASDEALYRALLAGDMSAFDALYARHAPALYGFARRQLGGDAGAAEDVLHEAFLGVLRERDPSRVARSFRAWLFTVARNLCLNRARPRRRAEVARAEVAHTPAEEGPRVDQRLEAREAGAALAAAAARLPPPMAELYRLRSAGLSYAELAEVLAVPLGTVKSRMHDLVERLRKEIEPWAAPGSSRS